MALARRRRGLLGLALLVTVLAAATTEGLDGRNLLAHQLGAALTAGAVLLAVAFVVVAAPIVRPGATSRGGRSRRDPLLTTDHATSDPEEDT